MGFTRHRVCQPEGLGMAGGQQARRIGVPSVDRADDVDDVGRRQVAPGRGLR
jgi:hypothetical protein